MTAPTHNYRTDAAYRQAMASYERLIERWPLPVQEHRVSTRHGQAFVLEFGQSAGPVLLLLHGSASNSATWGGEAEYYGKHFRVLAADLPGETGKSTPTRPPYTGNAYVEYVEDVLRAFGVGSTSLVGLSLGGWVGMRFAAVHPERVERLALIAPGGLAPAKKAFLVKAVLFRPFGSWGMERIARVVFAPSEPPAGAMEAFAFGLRNYRARTDNLPLVTDEELQQLTMPTLYVGGDRDGLLNTAASARRLRDLAPAAEVRVLRGRGHALIGTAGDVLPFLLGR